MLEMANYLPTPRFVPASYRLGVCEAGDNTSVERWSVADIPSDWHWFPYPESTQRRGRTPLLAVPSAAVPGGLESIVLANPVRLSPDTIRLRAVQQDICNPRDLAALEK